MNNNSSCNQCSSTQNQGISGKGYLHESRDKAHTWNESLTMFKVVMGQVPLFYSPVFTGNEVLPRGRFQTHVPKKLIALVTFQWVEFVMFVQKLQSRRENVALIFCLHNQQMSQKKKVNTHTQKSNNKKNTHKTKTNPLNQKKTTSHKTKGLARKTNKETNKTQM